MGTDIAALDEALWHLALANLPADLRQQRMTRCWTAASSSSSTRERVGLTCDNARATLLVQSHARTRAWLSALGPQS